MRNRIACLVLAAAVSAVAVPALAQTPPATIGASHVPAPWWMRDPVIASIGHVRVELPANRAHFSASFEAVDRSVDEASRNATDRVRALSRALADYGEDRVRVETTLSTRPLYDQYRDESGVLRDNARADQVERYQATATVSISIHDVSIIERVYAAVLAARPTSVGGVGFQLVPTNTARTNLANQAVSDAAARARVAAENAGTSLGGVRVIDPTGRACQTDVLAGWPSYGGAAGAATTVDAVTVTGARASRQDFAAASPVTTVGAENLVNADASLALQPPLVELTAQACIVYALN